MTGPAMPQNNPGFVQLPGGYNPQQQGASAPPPMPQAMQQFAQPAGPIGQPIEPGSIPMPQTQQPAAPQTPQPQAAPAGLDPNTRLSGPGIPPELQGRTVAEALHQYSGMRQVVMQMVPGPQQAAPLPGLPRPVAQPQPERVAQPAGPAAGPVAWDWRNPEQSMRQAIGAELDSRLAPFIQDRQTVAIAGARTAMIAEFGPVWTQLEPMIRERLQGADADALQNPQIWKVATEAVVGQLAMQAAARGAMPGSPATQGGPVTAAPQMQAPGQQPMPNLNGFFTEAPRVGAPVAAGLQLSAQQEWVRGQMGMTAEDYYAWSGGAQPQGARR